jgi:hypothetical protein
MAGRIDLPRDLDARKEYLERMIANICRTETLDLMDGGRTPEAMKALYLRDYVRFPENASAYYDYIVELGSLIITAKIMSGIVVDIDRCYVVWTDKAKARVRGYADIIPTAIQTFNDFYRYHKDEFDQDLANTYNTISYFINNASKSYDASKKRLLRDDRRCRKPRYW